MLSIAMPTYNGEKFLREQLDSIYSQTMVPDEVVVVDDCSTDGTVKILEEYKQKYGLHYYVNERNLGYNKNFEKAITLCTGDYIALCDQDDIWLPAKIEKSYNVISKFKKEEPSLVSSYSSTDKGILHKAGKARQEGDWRMNIAFNTSQGCTLMFNRKLLDFILPFNPNIIYDAYIGLTASLIGNRFYIGEELMWYRIHDNNAFAESKEPGFFRKIWSNLDRTVPFGPTLIRYKHLLVVKSKWIDYIKPDRIHYINSYLSIFESGKIVRICHYWKLKDVSVKNRVITSLALCFKVFFNIEDKF